MYETVSGNRKAGVLELEENLCVWSLKDPLMWHKHFEPLENINAT